MATDIIHDDQSLAHWFWTPMTDFANEASSTFFYDFIKLEQIMAMVRPNSATPPDSMGFVLILLFNSNICFINLHFSYQFRKNLIPHHRSNPMAHLPLRAIFPDAFFPMNLKGTYSFLALGQKVDHLKPSTQWIINIFKNGFRYYRKALAVASATLFIFADPMKRFRLQAINLFILLASWTRHPLRPTHFDQEVIKNFSVEKGDTN